MEMSWDVTVPDKDLFHFFQYGTYHVHVLFVTVFPAVLFSSESLLEDFLSVCHTDGSAQRAVELVQLSAAFCLSATPRLAKQTLAEFNLTEEQR